MPSAFFTRIRELALEIRLRFFAWQSPAELRRALATKREMRDSHDAFVSMAVATRPRLLVDVSTIINHDAGTGIQRVVRALSDELCGLSDALYKVEFIYATKWRGYRRATWQTGVGAAPTNDAIIAARGDVFLGLDLIAHILPHRHLQLARWKMRGVRIAFVIYDLLPAERPEWFTQAGARAHAGWLRLIGIYADDVACISHAVAGAFTRWYAANVAIEADVNAKDGIHVTSFPLGSDFAFNGAHSSTSLDAAIHMPPTPFRSGEFILMVGTVEPRKGYDQVLDAFEKYWAAGGGFALVMVGKRGWKVDELAERIQRFSDADQRLVWLQNCDDAQLAALYQQALGLLAASHGEGFGLPLVEAAHYHLPILARDLPVFREVAGEGATFFRAQSSDELADVLAKWIASVRNGTAAKPEHAPLITWADSARALCQALSIKMSR